jgi:hypothetical protein
MWFTSLLASPKSRARCCQQTHRNSALRRHSFVPRLEILENRTVPSTLTVLNALDSGQGSLRAAVGHAKDGDTIVFDSPLAGQTITLTSGELALKNSVDIEGLGASLLAVSGNDSSRVFSIQEGLTVTIAGLTITHGLTQASELGGGAILNTGSALTLADDVFSFNQAFGGFVSGGAVTNIYGGTLTVTDSTFVSNRVTGSIDGLGGAIANLRSLSHATVTHSIFVGNQAVGADGGRILNANNHSDLGAGQGGAIVNHDGAIMTVEDCTFTGNEAMGGNGGDAAEGAAFSFVGIAIGGAISNHDTSILALTGSTFSGNQAIGGSGITGGKQGQNFLGEVAGGALFNEGYVQVSDTIFDRNAAIGGNDNTAGNTLDLPGSAFGGAISTVGGFFGGTGAVIAGNCTCSNNQAIGGSRNTGGVFTGAGLGGALDVRFGAPVTVSNSIFSGNQAIGGAAAGGGNGGDGLGGAIVNLFGSNVTVSGCTFTGNQAVGGAGDTAGNGGNGFGGGV